jgi:hypothetical protein
MKTLFTWFVYSSANPQTIALTVRGLLSFLVFFGIDQALVTEGEVIFTQLFTSVTMTASLVVAAYGFLRKVHNTFK